MHNDRVFLKYVPNSHLRVVFWCVTLPTAVLKHKKFDNLSSLCFNRITKQKPDTKAKITLSKGYEMPKKNMTPEERKAFGEKMKLARAAKKNNVELPKDSRAMAEALYAPQAVDQVLNEDVAAMKRQIEELKALISAGAVQPLQSSGGRLIGSVEKYVVNPKHYPDPTERLAKEPRLQRFAFDQNYDLSFKVETTSYQTIDGINTREPRFTLELSGVMFDEDGNPTTKRYIARRAIFHEDPQAAIDVANHYDLPIDETNERGFLDEMRYLRMRDWLMEFFYPPKTDVNQNQHQEVVGNQVVSVFEVGDTSGKLTPDQLLKRI